MLGEDGIGWISSDGTGAARGGRRECVISQGQVRQTMNVVRPFCVTHKEALLITSRDSRLIVATYTVGSKTTFDE